MKRYLLSAIFFILLSIIVPSASHAQSRTDCDIIIGNTIQKYESNYDPDFWTCKGHKIIPKASYSTLNDVLSSIDKPECSLDRTEGGTACVPLQNQECALYLFNTIVNEDVLWDTPGTMKSCNTTLKWWQTIDSAVATGLATIGGVLTGPGGAQGFAWFYGLIRNDYVKISDIASLIDRKQKDFISSDALDSLELELDCGFAGQAGKNKCCTGDTNIQAQTLELPGQNCMGDVRWYGTDKCVLDLNTIMNPITGFMNTQVGKITGKISDKQDQASKVPQCVIGTPDDPSSPSCTCQMTSGAQICADMNPYRNNATVTRFNKLLPYIDDPVVCNEKVSTPIMGIATEDQPAAHDLCNGKQDSLIEKYTSFNRECSKCMDGNDDKTTNKSFYTAIGCIDTTPEGIIKNVFGIGIGLAGLIAFLCIIYSAFLFQTSQGDPEKIKKAQELMTSCITGLMMIIFSVFILRVISVDVLRIPGFSNEAVPTPSISGSTVTPTSTTDTNGSSLAAATTPAPTPTATTSKPTVPTDVDNHDCVLGGTPGFGEVYLYGEANGAGQCLRLVASTNMYDLFNLQNSTMSRAGAPWRNNWGNHCNSQFRNCVSSIKVGPGVKLFAYEVLNPASTTCHIETTTDIDSVYNMVKNKDSRSSCTYKNFDYSIAAVEVKLQ